MKQLTPEQQRLRRDRRAATAAMPKCRCGNVPRLGERLCTRCQEEDEREELQRRRDEFVDNAMRQEGLDREDAARWRALIGSARIRVLGSAGLRNPDGNDPNGTPWNGRAHIGLELWTQHEVGHEPSDAVEWLTKYVDIAVKNV